MCGIQLGVSPSFSPVAAAVVFSRTGDKSSEPGPGVEVCVLLTERELSEKSFEVMNENGGGDDKGASTLDTKVQNPRL